MCIYISCYSCPALSALPGSALAWGWGVSCCMPIMLSIEVIQSPLDTAPRAMEATFQFPIPLVHSGDTGPLRTVNNVLGRAHVSEALL